MIRKIKVLVEEREKAEEVLVFGAKVISGLAK